MRRPQSRRKSRAKPAAPPRALTVTIAELGHQGDGVVASDPPLYVPLTLPGEIVDVEAVGARGTVKTIRQSSPDRVSPPCPHFGVCGGCSVQHMDQTAYLAWKQALVASALAARGLDVPVEPVVPARPGTRRRAVLAARSAGRQVRLGYHGRMSHDLADIESCLILTPGLQALLPTLRQLVPMFARPKDELRLTVTETSTGFDLALAGGNEPGHQAIAELAGIMDRAGIARVTLDGETVANLTEPMVKIGTARAALPAGGFLQATVDAETALAEAVGRALAGAKRCVDLFAGVGTFALRLAETMPVHMAESEASHLEAGVAAGKRTEGLKPVSGEIRDLFAFPLSAKELARYDALVFDPPRAGAAAQAAEIAASGVKRVAAVSCNPATLARDLRILVDGGYVVDRVAPVDQFLYAPHIEVVATLSRPGK